MVVTGINAPAKANYFQCLKWQMIIGEPLRPSKCLSNTMELLLLQLLPFNGLFLRTTWV